LEDLSRKRREEAGANVEVVSKRKASQDREDFAALAGTPSART
jgi:hypothetical protein